MTGIAASDAPTGDTQPTREVPSARGKDDERFRLGVLLVHGIGTQPRGETLVRWGDALIKVLKAALGQRVDISVVEATLEASGTDRSAEMEVRLGCEGRTQRWLIAEGWWAEAFRAPTYRELVSWSFTAAPWSLLLHAAQGYWAAAKSESASEKLRAHARALLQLVVAFALAPFFVLFLGLSLVLGLLPIPQLRKAIVAAQTTLTASIGDSLAFVESPTRAALIRTRIIEQLKDLKTRCERTIIVAHSQGAAASLDALGGIVTEGETRPPAPVPDTLVTFGAGINQLVSLKVLSGGGLTRRIGTNPVTFGMAAELGAVLVFGWLYLEIESSQIRLRDLGEAAALFLTGVVVSSAAVGLLWLLVDIAARRWKTVERRREAMRIGIFVLVVMALAAFGVISALAASRSRLPFGPIGFLFMALMILAGSVAMLLSRDMATVLTAPVRRPAGLGRWVDFYASADPVTNGPTRAPAKALQAIPVWNRGSMLTDHTTYWENLDGFVLQVARECAETAGSTWVGDLPVIDAFDNKRAKWRARYLTLARWTVGALWLVIFGLIWLQYRTRLPTPFSVPAWSPEIAKLALRFATLAVLVVLASRATASTLELIWERWARAERVVVTAGGRPEGASWTALFFMGFVIWAVAALLYVLVEHPSCSLGEHLVAAVTRWQTWVLPAGFFALVSSALMRFIFLRPPKARPKSPTDGSTRTAAAPPASFSGMLKVADAALPPRPSRDAESLR